MHYFHFEIANSNNAYKVSNDDLALVKNNHILSLYHLGNNEELWTRELPLQILELFFLDDTIVVTQTKNAVDSYHFIAASDGTLLSNKCPLDVFSLLGEKIEGNIAYRGRDNKNNRVTGIYSQRTRQILFQLNPIEHLLLLTKDSVYSYHSNFISKRHISSGSLIWSHDFSQLSDVDPNRPISFKKFIGAHKDQLLVALVKNTIISLDIHSGELVDHWRDDKMVSAHMCLVSEQNKIVGLVAYTYTEIDLHTGKLIQYDLEDYFRSIDIACRSIGQGNVEGENIIFTSVVYKENDRGSAIPLFKIAAFSTITRKVVWGHNFENDYRRPQVHGNRIFIVDNDNVLHVFERKKIDDVTS